MVRERIEREILIDAPVDVVWAVVTEPEQISGWVSDSVELDLRPGGKGVLEWDNHGRVHGRVERVEPPRFFSFRWMVEHVPAFAEDKSTLVEFSLSTHGESTRLTVVETGFRDLPGPDDTKQGHVDGHPRGWEVELGQLTDYIARGSARSADR